EARQFDVMQLAAARGYALATNHPVFINNYAACLLIQRTNAPLAIELTLRRLTAAPSNPGANLNHALALLQNGRLDDAERILNRMARQDLTASNRTILEFARFELEMLRGHKEAALRAYRNIDLQHLMTPQIQWLEQAYQRLISQG
ncbi:MAG: tetratricopeptide repeat protein, partial [Verrucomicrobiae bacterium]|nr:tetratricopeptide repeat protein [Verrucomicrobiae bacterium]